MLYATRTLVVAAGLALVAAAGCGRSLTAPSESEATIAGTVDRGGSFTGAAAGLTGAAAPSSWTVTAVGANVTATIDAAGNFHLSGVPTGDVVLRFSNGLTTATITITQVGAGELIRITVTLAGDTAFVTSETRTAGKVELCHRASTVRYHLIDVSVNAEPAHRAHGDGAVGERVPAAPSQVFNAECHPVSPGVSIKKSTNGEDADQAPGPSIAVGGPVTWQYVVTNTGADTLTNVAVVDDRSVAVNCGGQTTVAVGQSMTCTGTGVAVAGQYRNVGTVTATSSAGSFTDSDASHYFGVPPQQDQGPQVQLCHRTGNGSYHLIQVGASAEPAHRAHGDARPGEAVPGSPGKVFTASCTVQ